MALAGARIRRYGERVPRQPHREEKTMRRKDKQEKEPVVEETTVAPEETTEETAEETTETPEEEVVTGFTKPGVERYHNVPLAAGAGRPALEADEAIERAYGKEEPALKKAKKPRVFVSPFRGVWQHGYHAYAPGQEVDLDAVPKSAVADGLRTSDLLPLDIFMRHCPEEWNRLHPNDPAGKAIVPNIPKTRDEMDGPLGKALGGKVD